MPRWNGLRAEVRLLSNYSRSAGGAAYFARQCAQGMLGLPGCLVVRSGIRKGGFYTDAPSGDRKSAVKFTNRCCQSQFMLVSIIKSSVLTVLLTEVLSRSLAHYKSKNSWCEWKFANRGIHKLSCSTHYLFFFLLPLFWSACTRPTALFPYKFFFSFLFMWVLCTKKHYE